MVMVILITGLGGIVLVHLGIRVLTGTFKRWYLGPRIFPPQAVVYGSIPFGIAAIELCIIATFVHFPDPDTTGWVMALTVGPTALFGYILAVWRPKWIKPHWVRWLEGNYSHKLHSLIAAARQDPKSWEKRVATQEGLEEWAREVAGEPQRSTDSRP
jgi:hypothetical protein